MKIINMNNRFFSRIAVLFALATVVFSCIKSDTDELAGKGVSLFRIQGLDANNFALVAFDAVKETRTVIAINRDAISTSDLSASTSIDFAVDQSIMDAYNTANGTSFVLLPASAYTLVGVTGSTFTFGSGEFVKEIQMNLDPSSLDLSQSYAFPVKLQNPAGSYKISNGSGFALVQIIIKNQYDGIYTSTGTRYNFNTTSDYTGWDNTNDIPMGNVASTGPWSFDTPLSTRGATTVNIHEGNSNGGFGYLNITVNSDNTVTIASTGETGVTNLLPLPGKTSTYNPSTKTFNLYYQYTNSSGTFRVLHDVAVYKGPQ